jgi:small subunit ribosomal protein S6
MFRLNASLPRASRGSKRRTPRERRTTQPMRRYELMLLLRPDLEDDKLQAAVEKVTRAIVNGGGSLSKVSPWGKRRLAYEIDHNREASYFLIHFDIEPSQVREIERGMLISEEILRHLVTVLEDRGPADELAPAASARDAGEDAADEVTEAGVTTRDGTSHETPDDTGDDEVMAGVEPASSAPTDVSEAADEADETDDPAAQPATADEERAEG